MPERIRLFEDPEKLKELKSWLSDGSSLDAMGDHFGMSSSTIAQFVQRNDLGYLRPKTNIQKHAPAHGIWKNGATIEKLKTLWAEGWSCSRIGAELGTSRNAVIGKVSRLGLQPRGTMFRSSGVGAPRRQRRTKVRLTGTTAELTWKPGRKTPFGSIVGPPAPRTEHDRKLAQDAVLRLSQPQENDVAKVSFQNLDDHHCRFVVGDVQQAGWGYCGDQKVPGLPYCPHHACRAYEGPKVERIRREMEQRETTTSREETNELADA